MTVVHTRKPKPRTKARLKAAPLPIAPIITAKKPCHDAESRRRLTRRSRPRCGVVLGIASHRSPPER